MDKRGRISLLDEKTINQIAAGEVIENSSSVIKELVENSLDAGADEIVVETLGGGRGLVRVTDNGHGMDRQELLLAIQRHATSKLEKVEDLEKIGTLGFRGEALPSIASVSKMRLSSGAEVEIEGGKVLTCKEQPFPKGSSIEVRSLFFNTPVRRKFQKSINAETMQIHRTLIHFALGYPHVSFTWTNEQEEKLFVEKGQSMEERVVALLGQEFAKKRAEKSEGVLSLRGLLGGDRHNRTGQYLFVNDRFVVSPFIAQRVLEGFGTRLATQRFPLFVLKLTLPSDWVDVNVHPQKREVRFREKERVGSFVRKAVDEALQSRPTSIRREPLYQHTPFQPPPFKKDEEWNFPMQVDPAIEIDKRVEEQLELKPTLHPLGVIGGFLLLRHREDGIAVVDLNGARSLLIEQRKEEGVMQRLLMPLMLDFEEELVEKLPDLERWGFALRHFGGRSFACEALPPFIEQEEAQGVIEEIILGRTPHRALSKRSFTVEEAVRLTEELIERGLEEEVMSQMKEEELRKRFKR